MRSSKKELYLHIRNKTTNMKTKSIIGIIILIVFAIGISGCSLQITIGRPVYQKIESTKKKEEPKNESVRKNYSYDWTRGYKMKNQNL